MNKIIALIVIVCSAAWLNHSLNSDLRAVQAGESKLVCVMKDGERVIDGSKVVGLQDGVWLFDNGHARNCEVVKGGVSYEIQISTS